MTRHESRLWSESKAKISIKWCNYVEAFFFFVLRSHAYIGEAFFLHSKLRERLEFLILLSTLDRELYNTLFGFRRFSAVFSASLAGWKLLFCLGGFSSCLMQARELWTSEMFCVFSETHVFWARASVKFVLCSLVCFVFLSLLSPHFHDIFIYIFLSMWRPSRFWRELKNTFHLILAPESGGEGEDPKKRNENLL